MGRSMNHPDYERTTMPPERRERLSAIHRARWGAPAGMATVMGVHVPLKYRDALRLWSNWVSTNAGAPAARRFVEQLRERDWADMPRIQELYEQRLAVRQSRKTIRRFKQEVYRVQNQNRR